MIGSGPQPDEMRVNGAQFPGPGPSRWGSVKIDFKLFAFAPVKFLKDVDQLHFIINGIQTQSYFWDQVVTIDQVRHTIPSHTIIKNNFPSTTDASKLIEDGYC